MFWEKFLIFIIGTAIGIVMVVYHRTLVRIVGTNSWAERIFGGGGTYFMWQLMGVLVVVITLLYITGTLESVGNSVGSIFRI